MSKEAGIILTKLDGCRTLIRTSDVLRITETMLGSCITFNDGSMCQVVDKFDDVLGHMGRVVQ